jgi:hypothetical protein
MKTLLCVAVLALGALGGQEKKPTGSGGYVQPAPFDVPPTEWDQEFPSVTSSIISCEPPLSEKLAAAGITCEKPDMYTVHESVCTKPGTHEPDPKRFPVADATGKTHCLALAAPQ